MDIHGNCLSTTIHANASNMLPSISDFTVGTSLINIYIVYNILLYMFDK